MPDSYMFNHLPNWGVTRHVCVECGWPGYGVTVPETQRRRHHRKHENARKHEAERIRLANLAKGRRLAAQTRRENAELDDKGQS
jgi:hypothetical protein